MHESIDSCRVGSAHHVTGGPFRVHLLLRGTNESHMQAEKVWGRYLHYTAQLDDAGNLLVGVQGELQRSMDETCRAHGKCDGVTKTFFKHLL